MKAVLRNIRSKIICSPKESRALDRELAVTYPAARFMMRYRKGWDGKQHFFNRAGGTLLTGLIGRVQTLFPDLQIEDRRKRPIKAEKVSETMLQGIELRENQIKAIKRSLKRGRGIIGIAVAGGKSEIAFGIWKALRRPGLLLVHRKDLLWQARDRFVERTGEARTVSVIGDGHTDMSAWKHDGLVIATVQSLTKLMETSAEFLKVPRLLAIDEAHCTGNTPRWAKVCHACTRAYYRIGMSGTPDTGDPIRDTTLEGVTGPMLLRVRSGDLIREGISVAPKIEFHRIENQDGYLPWHEARKLCIEQNEERNRKILEVAEEEAEQGKRTLILCNTVAHVRVLAEMAERMSVEAAVAIGKDRSEHRADLLKKLRKGIVSTAISTLFSEGTDIPELDTLVLAGSGKSSVRMLQRIGRALRKAPGKLVARVVDFFDAGNRYTEKHSQIRVEVCRREGFEVSFKE